MFVAANSFRPAVNKRVANPYIDASPNFDERISLLPHKSVSSYLFELGGVGEEVVNVGFLPFAQISIRNPVFTVHFCHLMLRFLISA